MRTSKSLQFTFGHLVLSMVLTIFFTSIQRYCTVKHRLHWYLSSVLPTAYAHWRPVHLWDILTLEHHHPDLHGITNFVTGNVCLQIKSIILYHSLWSGSRTCQCHHQRRRWRNWRDLRSLSTKMVDGSWAWVAEYEAAPEAKDVKDSQAS